MEGGFDIVIGNPPYISAPNQVASSVLSEQRQRIVESGKYKSLHEKWDLYIPFMERGLQLLCRDGIFSMIVPYPLSNQKYAKKMRKMLTEEYSILEIVDLNGTKIFENATVSNCIPLVRNSKPKGDLRITHINDNKVITEAYRKSQKNLTQDLKTYVWNLVEDNQESNLYSNMHTLADICYISVGLVINADEKENKGAFKKKDLISDTYDSIHCRKYIEAKDIDKYHVKRVRYLEWNTTRCPDRLRRPTFRELYDCPKLLINSIGTINATIDTEKHFLHNHSIICAVLWKDLKNVNNKSVSSSITKYCKLERKEMEQLSSNLGLFYVLGIVNSSIVGQILADMRGGALNIYPEHIRRIPIPFPSDDVQATIGDIAKEIIARKAQGEDCQYLELQLDELVEQLYKQ